MKMRNLPLAVFLGLLAVIHSSPIDTMTQIPARPEEDVLEEAMTDGFLVEHFLGPSFTTEPPKMNTTVHASQQPSLEILPEGSGLYSTSMTESHETNTTNVQTFFVDPSEGSGFLGTPTSPTTETPEVTRTISPSPQVTFEAPVEGSGFAEYPTTESSKLTSTVLQTSTDVLADDDDSSVFSLDTTKTSPSVSTASTSTSTMESVQSPFIKNPMWSRGLGSSLDLGAKPDEVFTDGVSTKQVHHPQDISDGENMHKGHSTPDWIIILAFLVALAALLALCAAIATRDKWNGPTQASENKTNASNQKRELEMQTFLHKEEPKENGTETEYTVIPLDDLTDNHS